MPERMLQDPSASTGSMRKLVPFLIFRDRTIERKIGVIAACTTVGRDPSCEIVLDDPGVSGRWGAIIRRGDAIFVQHEGGGPVELVAGEGFAVGPYSVVRADFGTELGRLWKTVEPPVTVQGDSDKPLYTRVVVLSAADMATASRAAPVTGGGVPARLTTYTAERRLTEKAMEAVDTISRAVARAAADPDLRGDADPALRALERLSYPELMAVCTELWNRKLDAVPELHTFFQRFLLIEPVQAYRFRAMVCAKYAAEARGSGERVSFPDLSFSVNMMLGPVIATKFFELTDAVAKIVHEGVW